jgi:hypothetical protein
MGMLVNHETREIKGNVGGSASTSTSTSTGRVRARGEYEYGYGLSAGEQPRRDEVAGR